MKTSITTYVLWAVYICLLAVLLPHTAWAFGHFEPDQSLGSKAISYVGAFAFEAAIAALTHKLSRRIEETPARKKGWARISYRYLNPIGFGLLMATVVSALANLAHAVEFGGALQIFTTWGIPAWIYSLAFGGILPLGSLIFAWVLSSVTDAEDEPNPELMQAKETVAELRKTLRQSEADRRAAEDRYNAIGDLVKAVFGEDKRQRILAARQQWPRLSGSAIAVIAEASPSYVSEVLEPAEKEG